MNRKKIVSTILPLFCLVTFSFAQLQQGSIAPDFTLRDINKKVWHLYDLTASGKTVFLDISSTWCGPCWRYHRQRSLDSLYAEHGPKGTKDQSCQVLFIEGDGSTTYADLNGTGKRTVGNWIADTEYPIIDPGADSVNNFMISYAVRYFPTVYMICPNNTIYLVGPGTMDVLMQNVKSGCPVVDKKTPSKNFSNDRNFNNGNFNRNRNAFFFLHY